MMKNQSLKNSKILKKSTKTSTQKPSAKIAVIGSGAWGYGISTLVANNGYLVHALSRDVYEAATVNKNFIKNKLSAIADTDFESVVQDAKFIFIVIPSDVVLSTLKSLSKAKIASDVKIIICSKGLDSKGLQLFSDSIEKELPKNNYAILSGPNFAGEVADGLPTVTTIASKDKKSAAEIVKVLKNDHFLPIISHDVIATQISGSIKNIFAIGCGIVDGLNLGENAKAALVLRGVTEENMLINKLGGKAEANFISPFGLGDLFLTCSSKKSRNNSLGFMIGSGKKVKEIVKSGTTFEGFKASESMIKFAKKHKIHLPLCEKINQILHGNFSTKEIKAIISKAILDY